MTCMGCGNSLDSRATFCANCGRSVDDPFIGQVIAERYEVAKRIAIGGFGSIYKAVQTDNDREVALKIMHRELAADANLVARFRREGEVLRQLRDRHTVATFELGETPDGLPFIAMELLEGESLLRLFQLHGKMPWQRVFKIAREICSALGEAHALGIVHRDLKPANIFVTNDAVTKVLDFGIARIMATSEMPNPQELTVMGTAVGTVEYMAPEQLMGGKADGRTDIYTVGVLAYELITGRRPFNAAGLELLTVQLTEEPTPLSSHQTVEPVPPSAEQVIMKCLAQDVSDRFADVHQLARALDEVLATRPRPQPQPQPHLQPHLQPQPRVHRDPTPMPIAPTRPPRQMPTERPVLERTEPVGRSGRVSQQAAIMIIAAAVFAATLAVLVAWLI